MFELWYYNLLSCVFKSYFRAVNDRTDDIVVEALKKFADFAAHTEAMKPEIKDVFTTVLRTAILYDDTENNNWNKMWKLLQVIIHALFTGLQAWITFLCERLFLKITLDPRA